jgi:plasmid rolling circle replication initiator protein Rep
MSSNYHFVGEDGYPMPTKLVDVSIKDYKFPYFKRKNQQLAERLRIVNPDAAYKLEHCADCLTFGITEGGEYKLRQQMYAAPSGIMLPKMNFCKQRWYCNVCQWRDVVIQSAKFARAKPALERDFPIDDYAWLFLTFTVRNPVNVDMLHTVQQMAKGWKAMSQPHNGRAGNPDWIFKGFRRALEISQELKPGEEYRHGYCHPHLHVIALADRQEYLNSPWHSEGNGRAAGAWLSGRWKKYMSLDYYPQVDVREIKGKTRKDGTEVDALTAALKEVLKYTVKVSDLFTKDIGDFAVDSNGNDGGDYFRKRPFEEGDFTPQLIKQMRGQQRYRNSRLFDKYIKGGDEDNLICSKDGDNVEVAEVIKEFQEFAWTEHMRQAPYQIEFDNGGVWDIPAVYESEYDLGGSDDS